jgi:hypothetical protein
VELAPGALRDEAVSSLCEWAKSHRYGFLRFSYSDIDLLARLPRIVPAQRFDSFPVYPGYGAAPFELMIDQKSGGSSDAGGVSS